MRVLEEHVIEREEALERGEQLKFETTQSLALDGLEERTEDRKTVEVQMSDQSKEKLPGLLPGACIRIAGYALKFIHLVIYLGLAVMGLDWLAEKKTLANYRAGLKKFTKLGKRGGMAMSLGASRIHGLLFGAWIGLLMGFACDHVSMEGIGPDWCQLREQVRVDASSIRMQRYRMEQDYAKKVDALLKAGDIEKSQELCERVTLWGKVWVIKEEGGHALSSQEQALQAEYCKDTNHELDKALAYKARIEKRLEICETKLESLHATQKAALHWLGKESNGLTKRGGLTLRAQRAEDKLLQSTLWDSQCLNIKYMEGSPAKKESELHVQTLKDALSALEFKLHQLVESMQTKDKEMQARSEERAMSFDVISSDDNFALVIKVVQWGGGVYFNMQGTSEMHHLGITLGARSSGLAQLEEELKHSMWKETIMEDAIQCLKFQLVPQVQLLVAKDSEMRQLVDKFKNGCTQELLMIGSFRGQEGSDKAWLVPGIEKLRGLEGPKQAGLTLENEGLEGHRVPAQKAGWKLQGSGRESEKARRSQEKPTVIYYCDGGQRGGGSSQAGSRPRSVLRSNLLNLAVQARQVPDPDQLRLDLLNLSQEDYVCWLLATELRARNTAPGVEHFELDTLNLGQQREKDVRRFRCPVDGWLTGS
ncbi:hypothetical protein L7F22_059178 [Adiantum nelumboides]|nr:hypothetical protein [Adiantum nelumboides]